MDPNTMTLLLLPLMAVAFYFLLIRPQRKRAQAQAKLLSQMQPGERVVTHSGIFGTLVSTGTRQSVIQIAPGVEITVLKQAVARVAQPGDEDEPDEQLVPGPADAELDADQAAPTSPEQQFDAYRPGEPSSLDLPEQPAVDQPASTDPAPTGEAAQDAEPESGIRDVTSTYFPRPSGSAATTESTQPTKDS